MADDLAAENERLKTELDALKRQQAQEKGPAQGTPICYQKSGELFCRPGQIASEGFTARVMRNNTPELHALIDYGEPPWESNPRPHKFYTDRPWNPLAVEETWHLPDECPRKGAPGCPYAAKPQAP